MHEAPPNPRAWLFRVASNLWIDRIRRLRKEPHVEPERAGSSEPRAAREAAGTLIARLSHKKAPPVVLKDAFDLTLEEIAEVLSTTVGAVKAALRGGRGKLMEPPESEPPARPRRCWTRSAKPSTPATWRASLALARHGRDRGVRVHTEYGPEAARKVSSRG